MLTRFLYVAGGTEVKLCLYKESIIITMIISAEIINNIHLILTLKFVQTYCIVQN